MERGLPAPFELPPGRCYIELLTALFSLLPAENLGTFDAGMHALARVAGFALTGRAILHRELAETR